MKNPQPLTWKIAVSLACLALLIFAGPASADVLFTDNFTFPSHVNSQDVNEDINAGRQAGPLGTNSYILNGLHHQVYNTGTDVGQPVVSDGNYVLVALNGNFQNSMNIAQVSTTTLTIEFDMYEKPDPNSTEWCGFSLRDSGNAFPVAGANEFGFIQRKNGGVQVFQNGANPAGTASWDTAGFAAFPHWKLVFSDTNGTGSAFAGNGSMVAFYNGGNLLGTVTFAQNFRSSDLFMGWNASGGGFGGIDNLSVQGTQARVLVTTATQAGSNPFTPSWTPESPDLIAGLSPTTTGGDFTWAGGNASVLTDDAIGQSGIGAQFASCGGASGVGNTLIYTLTNSPNGSDVTNIVVYSGWGDGGRFGQYYKLSYSTVSAPQSYIPLTTVCYISGGSTGNGGNQGAPASRVAITTTNGAPLGNNVSRIKFDFSGLPNAGNFNNGWQGYSEITVQGTDSAPPTNGPSPYLIQDTLPTYVETVVGDTVVFTAAYSNTPAANLQWLVVTNGVTNSIPGATSGTLTLTNVQLSDSGFYLVMATNSTDGTALPSYTTAGQLVVGSVPAPVNNIIMQYAGQNGQGGGLVFTPTWTVVTNGSLIAGMLPSDTNGNFALELTNRNISALTDGGDGSLQTVAGDTTPFTTTSNYLSCGVSPAGQSATYTLPGAPAYGYDLTNITVYGGWSDAGRNEQKYEVLYSSVANPTVFTSLGTFDYIPTDANNVQSATRTTLVPSGLAGAALAKNVYAMKINWNISPQPKNGWEGYSELVVQGAPSLNNPILVQDTLPAIASTMVGDQVVFTASFSNAPAASLQWQFINTNGVVTDISGANTGTLTLNNVQLADTGSYRLKAVNTGDALAISYSTAAPLTVSSVPAPVNNIIVTTANQLGLGPISGINVSTNFYPTWTMDTNNDLILGSQDGGLNSPGYVYAGGGNFAPAGSGCNGDPVVMSDGSFGYQNYYPGVGGNQTLDACGFGAGFSVTYTLPSSSSTGWSLTNITVYGGFGNNQRDELKYEVLYSTISAPTVFNHLVNVDYNPAGLPAVGQSATRTTLVPATGAIVQNVYAIEINWYNAASQSENLWSGISEIVVAGQSSPPVPVLTQDITPLTAEDVQGGSLTLTANFSGADSFQWQKNGTNVLGATSPTLTLNNLQMSDMATNTGYSLVASNASGTSVSSACKVFVDPAPAATNNIVTAFAYQTSTTAGFSPTWDTSALTSSLIYGQNPPIVGYDPTGNFNDPDITPASQNMAGGLPVLTDGGYGIFDNTGPHPAFATCGPTAGQYVIYTLGNYSPDPNGYDITNIQVSGGWNDNGRDSQYYTVLYSTVDNPTMFFPITSVAKNLSTGNGFGGGNSNAVPSGSGVPTTVRATFTPASGVLASHVYAIEVDYQFPAGVPNGYSGYSEISVFGSPSAAAPPSGLVITTAHEETNNLWTVETPNLIAGQSPSSFGTGSFANEGCSEAGLTDGLLTFGGNTNSASCGNDGTAVPWIVFSPTNGGSWNLTNIVVYTLWHDYGRDGQFYTLSYSTTNAPTTFLPLTSVAYNPFVPHDGRATGNRVQIAPPIGQTMLASNVAAVRFDFTQGSQDYGWSGYTEIVLQGDNLAPAVVIPPTIGSVQQSGTNLVVTGIGGTPNSPYTWLQTTNLSAPINWTTNKTGTLDGSGAFSITNLIDPVQPTRFFRIRLP